MLDECRLYSTHVGLIGDGCELRVAVASPRWAVGEDQRSLRTGTGAMPMAPATTRATPGPLLSENQSKSPPTAINAMHKAAYQPMRLRMAIGYHGSERSSWLWVAVPQHG